MRRHRPDIHLLHASEIFVAVTGDGDGDEEDAYDGVKCAVVWTQVDRGAMGGCGIGVWWCGGGGVDCETGEVGEGGGEEEGEDGGGEEVDVIGERGGFGMGDVLVPMWVYAFYRHCVVYSVVDLGM